MAKNTIRRCQQPTAKATPSVNHNNVALFHVIRLEYLYELRRVVTE